MFKRYSSLTLGLATAMTIGVLLSELPSRAAQSVASPPQRAQTAAKSGEEEGPVALTERTARPEKKEEVTAIPHEHFGLISAAYLNNRGDVAIVSRFPTAKGDGSGVFVRKADGTWTATRDGEKAVNLTPPLLTVNGTHLADNGDLTFTGTIDGPPVTTAFLGASEPSDPSQLKSLGVFTKTAEGLKIYTQSGEEVPNMPSKFYGYSNASRNSKGTIAFIGTYADPDGRGLFVIEDGKMKLVARSGQRTPAGPETLYSEHFFPSSINERGELAFFCHISGGAALFLKRPDNKVETIVVQGQPSPVAGAKFSGFANRAPVINSKGDVAFSAFLDGPKAGRALFFKPQGGPVKMLARSGDKLPEMAATFTDFYMPSVNARGDVAFIGTFGGRTRGVFLKTAQGIEKIALADEPVPGQKRGTNETVVFNNFLFPQVNDNGDLVFVAQLRPATIAVYLKKKGGELEKVAQIGDKTPLAK
jgi:hypothetical protein